MIKIRERFVEVALKAAGKEVLNPTENSELGEVVTRLNELYTKVDPKFAKMHVERDLQKIEAKHFLNNCPLNLQ